MSIKSKLIAKFTELLEGPLTLDKAIAIAVVAHAGQEDKGQNSYIRHPLRVMEQLDCEDEMICGVCHDVVEDTPVSLEDLTGLGFTLSQVKTIEALTKRDGETYPERIQRVKNSYVARKIKTLDIRDNSALWRLKSRKLAEKDMERMQHYIDALNELGALHQR
jgi:GTP diphosphokinase / guanosine-3',5'-bis(diphosphate) 3'-diphosphatase